MAQIPVCSAEKVINMKRKDAERIIHAEKLISYNFFEDRNDASDEMVIKKVSNKWSVYATDERASKIISGEVIYDDEETALDNFIRRLRAMNKVRDSIYANISRM